MPNRLKLVGILNPPSNDAWQPGVGIIRFSPADEKAETWSVPGYRPAWPILGVPNALSSALQELNGGDLYVPGSEPGDAHDGPWMKVDYELQTTAGTWHRGTYKWRAVSTGGGQIDLRTPAPEDEPDIVARPGVPAGALLTTDVDNLVPSKVSFDAVATRDYIVAESSPRANVWIRKWASGYMQIFGQEVVVVDSGGGGFLLEFGVAFADTSFVMNVLNADMRNVSRLAFDIYDTYPSGVILAAINISVSPPTVPPQGQPLRVMWQAQGRWR